MVSESAAVEKPRAPAPEFKNQMKTGQWDFLLANHMPQEQKQESQLVSIDRDEHHAEKFNAQMSKVEDAQPIMKKSYFDATDFMPPKPQPDVAKEQRMNNALVSAFSSVVNAGS